MALVFPAADTAQRFFDVWRRGHVAAPRPLFLYYVHFEMHDGTAIDRRYGRSGFGFHVHDVTRPNVGIDVEVRHNYNRRRPVPKASSLEELQIVAHDVLDGRFLLFSYELLQYHVSDFHRAEHSWTQTARATTGEPDRTLNWGVRLARDGTPPSLVRKIVVFEFGVGLYNRWTWWHPIPTRIDFGRHDYDNGSDTISITLNFVVEGVTLDVLAEPVPATGNNVDDVNVWLREHAIADCVGNSPVQGASATGTGNPANRYIWNASYTVPGSASQNNWIVNASYGPGATQVPGTVVSPVPGPIPNGFPNPSTTTPAPTTAAPGGEQQTTPPVPPPPAPRPGSRPATPRTPGTVTTGGSGSAGSTPQAPTIDPRTLNAAFQAAAEVIAATGDEKTARIVRSVGNGAAGLLGRIQASQRGATGDSTIGTPAGPARGTVGTRTVAPNRTGQGPLPPYVISERPTERRPLPVPGGGPAAPASSDTDKWVRWATAIGDVIRAQRAIESGEWDRVFDSVADAIDKIGVPAQQGGLLSQAQVEVVNLRTPDGKVIPAPPAPRPTGGGSGSVLTTTPPRGTHIFPPPLPRPTRTSTSASQTIFAPGSPSSPGIGLGDIAGYLRRAASVARAIRSTRDPIQRIAAVTDVVAPMLPQAVQDKLGPVIDIVRAGRAGPEGVAQAIGRTLPPEIRDALGAVREFLPPEIARWVPRGTSAPLGALPGPFAKIQQIATEMAKVADAVGEPKIAEMIRKVEGLARAFGGLFRKRPHIVWETEKPSRIPPPPHPRPSPPPPPPHHVPQPPSPRPSPTPPAPSAVPWGKDDYQWLV